MGECAASAACDMNRAGAKKALDAFFGGSRDHFLALAQTIMERPPPKAAATTTTTTTTAATRLFVRAHRRWCFALHELAARLSGSSSPVASSGPPCACLAGEWRPLRPNQPPDHNPGGGGAPVSICHDDDNDHHQELFSSPARLVEPTQATDQPDAQPVPPKSLTQSHSRSRGLRLASLARQICGQRAAAAATLFKEDEKEKLSPKTTSRPAEPTGPMIGS